MRRQDKKDTSINSGIQAGVLEIIMDMAVRRKNGRKSDPWIPPEVPLSRARTATP